MPEFKRITHIFLTGKLDNTQAIGVVVAIIGFFLAVLSDIGFNNSEFSLSLNRYTIVTLGDIEAIISALGFANGCSFYD